MRVTLAILAAVIVNYVGTAAIAKSTEEHVGFSVTVHGALAGAESRVAINEAVWVDCSLHNGSAQVDTLWINGKDTQGVACWRLGDAKEQESATDAWYGDIPYVPRRVVPGGVTSVSVPLPKALYAKDPSEERLVVGLSFIGHAGRQVLTDTVVVEWDRKLTAQEVRARIDGLRRQLHVGNVEVRLKAVKSLGLLSGPSAWPAFVETAADSNEAVLLAAIDEAVVAAPSPAKLKAFLKHTQRSQWRSVRKRSAAELTRLDRGSH